MKFQREYITDETLDEMLPLLKIHWHEVAHFQDIPLDVDREMYKSSELNGMMRMYTARNETGAMVGYAVFLLRHNPHYKTSYQALQDVIFIHPKERGIGQRFVLWCDEQLKLEGVQAVYHHVKAAHNFGPKLLEPIGYKLVDLIYARRLD